MYQQYTISDRHIRSFINTQSKIGEARNAVMVSLDTTSASACILYRMNRSAVYLAFPPIVISARYVTPQIQ